VSPARPPENAFHKYIARLCGAMYYPFLFPPKDFYKVLDALDSEPKTSILPGGLTAGLALDSPWTHFAQP
jgi:hypothetical protein